MRRAQSHTEPEQHSVEQQIDGHRAEHPDGQCRRGSPRDDTSGEMLHATDESRTGRTDCGHNCADGRRSDGEGDESSRRTDKTHA